MDREEAETILSGAGSVADGDFPLLEAAIACAIHEEPARDPATAREVAAIAVERLAQRLKRESPEEAIAETMSGDLGLSGDLFTPEDPDNADLLALAGRRRGSALT